LGSVCFRTVRLPRLLQDHGIDLFLDVGANAGQTGTHLRSLGYQGRIVSFEPQSATHAKLKEAAAGDPDWETRATALGSEDGSVTMNISAFSPSSSLLPMERRHLAVAPQSGYVGTETVPLARLDTLWDRLRRPGERPFLKLDVQGFELPVLRGARNALRDIRCVGVELLIVDLYRGQSRYHELLGFLDAQGFDLVGFEEPTSDATSGHLLWVDALLVRRGEERAG
jgi:FkbM family methyltransferase